MEKSTDTTLGVYYDLKVRYKDYAIREFKYYNGPAAMRSSMTFLQDAAVYSVEVIRREVKFNG